MSVRSSAQILQSALPPASLYKEGDTSRSVMSPAGKILGRQFQLQRDIVAAATTYTIAERHLIVGQLRLALADFYVHLERKKLIYGFDPVRALDLLAPTVERVPDAEFHQSIVELVARTRDRHLVFMGRAPFGSSATLPFTIEKCWEAGVTTFVVTKIDNAFTPQRLRAGAVVTHWNGAPIERFIRLNANVFDGGNEAAAMARSLAFLTQRPLSRFGAPFEEWVDLSFVLNDIAYEERFTWQGFDSAQVPPTPSLGRNLNGFGGDLELLHLQHARRVQFAPGSFDAQGVTASTAPGVPQITRSAGNFDYGSVTTQYGTYGYIRLWSFTANSADDIVNSFIPVFQQLPKAGLIIDIRGNTGGYIAAGERVLQLFTPRTITPTRFEFRVTAATHAMVSATTEFQTWQGSFNEALATGEPYSQGYPIEGTDEDANKIGQRYFGPVVVITDALAFSTADMFTAGFIDHDIGRVICTDENMAAAGGNNWVPWDIVRLYNPDFSLDLTLKPTFDSGVLSQGVRDAFNREGTSLSEKTSIQSGQPQYEGTAWRITDGDLVHVVRHLPWMNKPLRVYLHHGRLGLRDMPQGITLSLTMRRCVRTKKNEGRLLEDLGIQPDIVYQMTFKDIVEQNQDLIARASLELSQMPAYDLVIDAVPKSDGYGLTCRTVNLTSVEICGGEKLIAMGAVNDGKTAELFVPGPLQGLIVKGLKDDQVAARVIMSPASATSPAA
jgi:peptidase S41-like protein